MHAISACTLRAHAACCSLAQAMGTNNFCGHTAGTRISAHWKPSTCSMGKHHQLHRATNLCGHAAGTRKNLRTGSRQPAAWANSAPSSHKFMRTHRRHTHICALEAANPQHEQARTNPSTHPFMRAHCRHTHCHTTRIATIIVSRKAGSYGNCCACIGFIDKQFFRPFSHIQELRVCLSAHSILQHNLLVRSTVSHKHATTLQAQTT